MTNDVTDHQTYYVPDQSKYPILATLGLIVAVLGGGNFLNNMSYSAGEPTYSHWVLFGGLVFFIAVLWQWFGTTIRENRAGLNSPQLNKSYVIGMQWFIFSEVMFFFAFFFALAYLRIFVGPWLGGEGDKGLSGSMLWSGFEFNWPMNTTPQDALKAAGVAQLSASGTFMGADGLMDWRKLPLLNTILLLSSSVTVHFAHTALLKNNRKGLTAWLGLTLLLGFTFVGFQVLEYYEAYHDLGLTLGSGIYGSTFFLLTGFHGFHVCMGAVMLTIMWLRATTKGHFTSEDCFGFEAASWYWHFVDVVWICLFLFVYIL